MGMKLHKVARHSLERMIKKFLSWDYIFLGDNDKKWVV